MNDEMITPELKAFDNSNALHIADDLCKALDQKAPPEVLTRLTYSLADGIISKVLEESPASCKKACGACCKQSYIGVELVDAEMISKITNRPLSRFKSGKNWKGIPCVFFDSQTSTCSIYEHRPLACRVSISFDDPIKCESEEYRKTLNQQGFYVELLHTVGHGHMKALLVSRGDENDAADIRDFFPPM